jgi:hypothetical protein
VTKQIQLTLAVLVGAALLLATSATVEAISIAPAGRASSTILRSAHNEPPATNLIVTPAVRKSLFDADAAYHSLPPSDYVGLAKGVTYYAYDSQNHRYYAAAGLVPSSKSQKAQIGTQDDGGYNLFFRPRNSSKWTVFNDGLGGAEDSICPITIPAAVRKVWDWTMHACYPNSPY